MHGKHTHLYEQTDGGWEQANSFLAQNMKYKNLPCFIALNFILTKKDSDTRICEGKYNSLFQPFIKRPHTKTII